MTRDEALAELATRYFASHGPATVRDFAWWSGLTVKDAQRGDRFGAAALESSTIGGVTYWSAEGRAPSARRRAPSAMLLPNYDEYLIAYKDRAAFVDQSRAANIVARSGGAFAQSPDH